MINVVVKNYITDHKYFHLQWWKTPLSIVLYIAIAKSDCQSAGATTSCLLKALTVLTLERVWDENDWTWAVMLHKQ